MESFYANAFAISNSDGNVMVVFELTVQGRESEGKAIVMSPQGFKSLIQVAAKHLEDFEREQGRIQEWNPTPEAPENRLVT